MRKIAISSLAMMLVGCSLDWSGSFVGTALASGTCADGSSGDSESAVRVDLQEDGDTVTWEAGCGATAIADVDGDVAQVRQYSCPAETQSDGTTTNTTVEGGTLTLDDNTLIMDLNVTVSLSGTVTGTCDLTVEGTLDRLDE